MDFEILKERVIDEKLSYFATSFRLCDALSLYLAQYELANEFQRETFKALWAEMLLQFPHINGLEAFTMEQNFIDASMRYLGTDNAEIEYEDAECCL